MDGMKGCGDKNTDISLHQNCFLFVCLSKKFSFLNVLATSDDGLGATSADLAPLEGSDRTPAVDAVEDADNPHDDGDEQAQDVRHAHDEEADGDVDEALHEAVVEEGELGGHKRHVQLAENHDHTKGDHQRGKNEEGPAHVLVAEEAVRVEDGALVHTDGEMEAGTRVACPVVGGHAEVVVGDGEIVKRKLLVTTSYIASSETTSQIMNVVGISLKYAGGTAGVPLESENLVRTSPEIGAGECLIITISHRANICGIPLEEGGSE